MTPKFHSTLRLQTLDNGTHWRLKYTPIHMFNQDSTPIWSLQDSTPILNLQDSTPLHLLAHTSVILELWYQREENSFYIWKHARFHMLKICVHCNLTFTFKISVHCNLTFTFIISVHCNVTFIFKISVHCKGPTI